MGKALLLFIPLALIYAGVKVWHMMHPAASGAPVSAKVEKAEKVKETPKPVRPEVVVETWASGYPGLKMRGEEIPPYVRSGESGVYLVGEISAHGMVEAIRFTLPRLRQAVVRCAGVDGPVFVVVTDRQNPADEGDGNAPKSGGETGEQGGMPKRRKSFGR